MTIPLTFLNNPSAISRHDHGLAIKYKATLYRDAEDADWETRPYAYNIEEREVTADDTIRGLRFCVSP